MTATQWVSWAALASIAVALVVMAWIGPAPDVFDSDDEPPAGEPPQCPSSP